MVLDSKLSVLPVTVAGAQAIARYREWAKVSDGFGASFIALHEASHAVTSVVLDLTLRFTEIVSRLRKDGLYAGYTELEPKNTIAHHHNFKLAIIAAAPIVLNAQLNIPDGDLMIDDDRNNVDSIGADLKAAGKMFVPFVDFRRHVLKWTASIVSGNQDAIQETARHLDLKKKLLGEEVLAIVERHQTPALPLVVQAVCGFITGFEAERVLRSYTDNLLYRSNRTLKA